MSIAEESGAKKISVIIPCYNVEKYIDRCLESLVNQTIGIENLELILIDDASTDTTLDQLKKWEKQYPESVMVIVCKQNGRQGTARNIGFDYSSSPLISYVDADDWVEPVMFEKMYQKMQETDAELIVCQAGRDWGDGNLCMVDDYQGPFNRLQTIHSDTERHEMFRTGLCSGVWAKLYKKSFLVENNIFFPEQVTYEDNYFVSLVSFCVKSFVVLDGVYYHYFFNENSTVSQKNSVHQYDRLQVEIWTQEELLNRGFGRQFSDEIEERFLKIYYIGTLHILFTRFSKLPYDLLHEMQEEVWKRYPHCLQDTVYKNMEEIDQILMSTLKRKFSEKDWDEIADAYKEFCDEINEELNSRSSVEKQENTFYLREVTASDCDLLFLWCNDPQCRANSLNPARISYEEHCRWFSEKLASLDCRIYLCIEREAAVGQVRLDMEGDTGVISYSIAADCRGRGLGYRMLQNLEEVMPQRVRKLHAVVKEDNIASQRCFEKLGYRWEKEKDVYHYWKNIVS